MLIIKFYQKRYTDTAQVPFDTGYFAFDGAGRMAMKVDGPALPKPEAFTDDLVMLGIASLRPPKRIEYTFQQITPELIDGSIYGLSRVSTNMPAYTVVIEDLGRKLVWSRGIEKIYFL